METEVHQLVAAVGIAREDILIGGFGVEPEDVLSYGGEHKQNAEDKNDFGKQRAFIFHIRVFCRTRRGL